jgi:hypothetical protein
MRDLFLRGLVLCGTAAAVLTELLSPFHLLRRGPLLGAWIALLAAAAAVLWIRRPPVPRLAFKPAETAIAAAILAIACIVGAAAILSPPNSADAMAYHMPRVVYWAQSASVAFFPTPYLNQISLPPLAEYLMLHTYVISGGDRFINLVAFGAFLGSIAGVSALAAALGLKGRGQAMAALFCATLPAGILQASGAKNDWLVTLWLVSLAFFLLRRDVPFAALSLGLAIATKSTAYLFAPPLILALCWWLRREDAQRFGLRPAARLLAALALGVLLVNGPQYLRNLGLSGSPLGYDSAQGDGFFRWRNEYPGWKSTISNALRNTSEQLGARSPRWNQAVYDAVVRAHAALGIDPQDPATTWRWSRYDPPRNANHEANANNRWHLAWLAAAFALAAFPGRRRWMVYAAGLAGAFLLFCFYLKWQPFLGRLELPLFVLAAPLGGMLLESLRPAWLAVPVCLFLLAGARLALFENWTRPLRGPHSLWVEARDDAYFNDMGQWDNRASYLGAVDLAARSACDTVGLDISENQIEYPFQTLLLRARPSVRFVHTGVGNASARYYPPHPPRPCAVLCLDCIGNRAKLALYAPIGEPVVIGRFLLFLPPDGAERR